MGLSISFESRLYWRIAGLSFILSVVAVMGCAGNSSPSGDDTPFVQSHSRPKLTFAEYRDAGDRFMAAGDHYRALEVYLRAKDLNPSDPGILFRIVSAAADARQREAGLEAVQKLIALKVKAKTSGVEAGSDPGLLALKARLEALPKRDPAMLVKLAAIESIVYEMRDETDPRRFTQLAEQARGLLREFVRVPGFADPDVWRLSGYVAVAMKDPSLAAYSFEAIERLRPDYSTDVHLRGLMTELIKLPISEKIKLIPKEQASLKGSLERLATNDSPVPHCDVGANFMNGRGVPIDHKFALAHYERGVALWQSISPEEAAWMDAQAVEFAAQNCVLYYAFGNLGIKRDDDTAKRYLRRLIELRDGRLISLRKENAKADAGAAYAGIVAMTISDAFRGTSLSGGMSEAHGAATLPHDPARAEKWLRVECDLVPDEWNSHDRLALFLTDKVPPDFEGALREFTKGADLGNNECMYNIAVAYWNGNGTIRNPDRAVEWWRKAVRAGSEEAKTALTSRGYSW